MRGLGAIERPVWQSSLAPAPPGPPAHRWRNRSDWRGALISQQPHLLQRLAELLCRDIESVSQIGNRRLVDRNHCVLIGQAKLGGL